MCFTVSKYQEMVCAGLADINQASAESCCQLNLTKRKQKNILQKDLKLWFCLPKFCPPQSCLNISNLF